MPSDTLHSYEAAGLIIRSEFALPELIPCSSYELEADVDVRFEQVPDKLVGATPSDSATEVTPTEVLLSIPHVARYLVRAGRHIGVDPAPGALPRDLRAFLLGSAFGALFFQRGYFPLHAGVVVIDGEATAFTGASGSGKSTLTAWLHAQGYPLLCDDVCVIRFDDREFPLAYPGFPRLKLWQDSLQAFDIDTRDLQRDHARAEKYHLPVSERFCNQPVPLRQIYVLRFSDPDIAPYIADISAADAVPILRDNTYRFEYISGLGLTRSHFLDCVKLARAVQLHYLFRPRDHAALAACQRLIEEHLK